ncbi:MAG: hypothetical protein ACRDD7_01895, partial [Peptostreptococcaceae bacterium]
KNLKNRNNKINTRTNKIVIDGKTKDIILEKSITDIKHRKEECGYIIYNKSKDKVLCHTEDNLFMTWKNTKYNRPVLISKEWLFMKNSLDIINHVNCNNIFNTSKEIYAIYRIVE